MFDVLVLNEMRLTVSCDTRTREQSTCNYLNTSIISIVHVCVRVHMCAYMCACVHVCACTCACTYVCVCVYAHICACAYMCTCACTYMDMNTKRLCVIDGLTETAKKHDMKINVKKTKSMIVSRQEGRVVNLLVDGQQGRTGYIV
jgi:hypothetical protein